MEIKKESMDRFSDFLINQSKIIREQPFDENQIEILFKTLQTITIIDNSLSNRNKFAEALFEFNLACQIAYSNYRTENKTMWTDRKSVV